MYHNADFKPCDPLPLITSDAYTTGISIIVVLIITMIVLVKNLIVNTFFY